MSNVIHETVLKDIIDVISDTKDFFEDEDKAFGGSDYHFTSLTKNAKDLVLVFPVLCTKGISIETASMIAKAIEKNCVTLLELLFASVQITDTTGLKNYIAKFHSNISIGDKITVDDFIDFTNSISEAAEAGIIEISDKDAYKLFKENMNNFGNVVKTTLNENSLADFNCYNEINGRKTVLEAKDKLNNKIVAKLSDDLKEERVKNRRLSDSNANIRNNNKVLRHNYQTASRENRDLQKTAKRYEAENKKLEEKYKEYVATTTRNNQINGDKTDLIDRYSNNDIKKANELMPTKVVVNFLAKDKDTGRVTKVDKGIIGVKCKLYSVDSMEIIERISTKYADSNWVRELVRATSGEISFWRDFVFALDRARIDAINSSKKGSSAKMFKVLERRATKHRLTRWKANRADSAPITTLVINQDEVEYLKKDYDINIENKNIAGKLMESYNLMGLVIVDEPSECASFIWDEGNNASFETMSFRNLERDSNDKNYRKVISLMTKMAR